MVHIVVDSDLKLSKTHFKNFDELRLEISLAEQKNYVVPEKHKRLLDQRMATEQDQGRSWESIKAELSAKYAA